MLSQEGVQKGRGLKSCETDSQLPLLATFYPAEGWIRFNSPLCRREKQDSELCSPAYGHTSALLHSGGFRLSRKVVDSKSIHSALPLRLDYRCSCTVPFLKPCPSFCMCTYDYLLPKRAPQSRTFSMDEQEATNL